MKESNEKKQVAALWILGVLVVILIAIIAGLFITQAKNKNQEVALKDAKIAQMEQEITQLKNRNSVSNTIINETTNSTIKYNNTEDLNEEKEQIIRKLLLEQMPYFSFQESVPKDRYKITGKYIDKIDIFSEAYYATKEYDTEKIQENVEWYKNNMNYTTFGTVEAIGTVSFTTEFDKIIDSNDMIVAGSRGSMQPYKNYVVQNFLFTLWKQNNGEYKLELGTGW